MIHVRLYTAVAAYSSSSRRESTVQQSAVTRAARRRERETAARAAVGGRQARGDGPICAAAAESALCNDRLTRVLSVSTMHF